MKSKKIRLPTTCCQATTVYFQPPAVEVIRGLTFAQSVPKRLLQLIPTIQYTNSLFNISSNQTVKTKQQNHDN